ncbi:hypothetical protein [Allofustis seminis]|uniref:hypothetical protein n=1 Tax=Allofustis seminis TaxID=166939 RepID=UPI00036302CD|nr:hypothetical protein [Allofustis seminis]
MNSNKSSLVEIWGDMVEINDLIKAIVLTVTTTMGGYFLAPDNQTSLQLFFGLGGALVGFLLATVWIKPKRILTQQQDSSNSIHYQEENK